MRESSQVLLAVDFTDKLGDTWQPSMNEHLWLSLVIPAAFLGVTGLVKCLVKSTIAWSNFYLGLDASLAALANGIGNIADIAKDGRGDRVVNGWNPIAGTCVYIVFAFSVLLVVMLFHQRWEKPPEERFLAGSRTRRGIMLGIVANFMGSGTLLMFIYARLKGTI